MPKRIRNLVLLIALILLGFFVSKFFVKPAPELKSESISSRPLVPQQTTPAPQKVAKNQDIVKVNKEENELSLFLKNAANSPQDRVYRVRDLDLSVGGPNTHKNIEGLIVFINSENPYHLDPEAQQPHTFKSYQLQKEASLRVYSMKRLSTSLPLKDLRTQFQKIIEGSKDQAISNIAKKVLAAKEKGEDYFENMKNGIRSLKVPAQEPAQQEDEHAHH